MFEISNFPIFVFYVCLCLLMLLFLPFDFHIFFSSGKFELASAWDSWGKMDPHE